MKSQTGPVQPSIDERLLARFETELRARVPFLVQGETGPAVVNATPLEDLTGELVECARVAYGLVISRQNVKVYGKFDSRIFGGSVKVRPAIQIIEDAIASGELRSGQTVFEASSGNFGSALGMLRGLGLDIVVLVSRKLQDGVLDELKKTGVRTVNLDVDICPAPGLKVDMSILMAKTAAENLRGQLAQLGLDISAFDHSRGEIEGLLARQDVINLARHLAKVYDGFCPEQYDNELNVTSHETVTALEIDQQLKAKGDSLADFRVICTFGTGGTSVGLSKYLKGKYQKKAIHVVFPLSNQDVAGIRTRDKAIGLKFYLPELFAGQHEVDFEAAKPLLSFFVSKGYDIGESSALALYACLQMLNFGVGKKFVVMIADGISKYQKGLEISAATPKRYEVTFEEASSNLDQYGDVLWTHSMFVPKEEGIKLIASALQCEESRVKIARAQDVQTLISSQELPETVRNLLPRDNRRLLLVCMAGATSLRVAEILSKTGVDSESLAGGIMKISEQSGSNPSDIVRIASE